MSGVNITCNIGNQLGNGGGEMKFEVASKDNGNLASCIATEIVNEILENALDIATMGGVTGLHCDTIAFSVDDGVCSFPSNNFKQKMSKSEDNVEEINDECPDIKEIIEGLSAIHIPKNNTEEPLRLDVEMKRLLNEMMCPPYDIVNYETLARKDGVGDQPIEEFVVPESEEMSQCDDDCLVDIEKTKLVEKKTRVTDLVMNSKQVLSELLMSDESRKQQEEWEEKNEKVIQIIEFEEDKLPQKIEELKEEDEEENQETEEDKTEVVEQQGENETQEKVVDKEQEEEKEDIVLPVEHDQMDNVDLSVIKTDVDYNKEMPHGAGEMLIDVNLNAEKMNLAGSSNSKSNSLHTTMAKEICKKKIENLKKKKWNINLKFWGKKKQKENEAESKGVIVDK